VDDNISIELAFYGILIQPFFFKQLYAITKKKGALPKQPKLEGSPGSCTAEDLE